VEKSILIYFCLFFAALFIRGWAKGVLKYSKALMMMGKHGKVLKPSSLSLKKNTWLQELWENGNQYFLAHSMLLTLTVCFSQICHKIIFLIKKIHLDIMKC
jgi:hypothetical protein